MRQQLANATVETAVFRQHPQLVYPLQTAALDDDLNISAAWAAIFDWVSDTNKRIAGNIVATEDAAINNCGLGNRLIPFSASVRLPKLKCPPKSSPCSNPAKPRGNKDFKRSDQIRDELKAKGWVVER